MKIIAAVAVAAVLAGAALAAFANIIISPERVRATVIPLAEKALGRTVRLGDISISFFSGIILHDLRITEPGSDEVFISATQASLRYRLLPLLSLRVVIDELSLEEPHITITRLPDRTFNCSDLIGTAEGEKRPQSAGMDAGGASRGAPVSLMIATVRVNRGSILFIDRAARSAVPIEHRISRLAITADANGPDGSFPFAINCRIHEAPLSINGQADIAGRSANLHIALKNLDATALLPYVAELPARINSCSATLDANVAASPGRIESSGTLALRSIDLVLNDLPDAPVRQASLSAEFDLAADLNASAVQLRSTRINYNGITAQASGRIEQAGTKPQLALDIQAPGLTIPDVLAALPPKIVADASAINPSGSIDIQARLEGQADSAAVLKKAEMRLRDVRATLGSIRPALSGTLQLTDGRLRSQDLVLEADGSRATIDLTAENIFAATIRTTQNIRAERFNFDALLQPSRAGSKGAASKKTPPKPSEEIGPFDLNVHADGTVKIARAVYRGLPISDFACSYRLLDNILTVENITGNAAGGTFTQDAHIDLSHAGLAYKTTLSMQGMQADPVLSALAPGAKGIVSGTLKLDLNASGQGTLPDSLKKNLKASARMDLNDGRITGLGLAKRLAAFLKIDELRELRFNTCVGNVNIENGQARLDAEMLGPDVRMAPRGLIGLDGALDILLNAALSPALMQKIDKRGRASFLADQQGWSLLPLQVKGTIEQPHISLNTDAFKGQLIDTLQQRLIDRWLPGEKSEDTSGSAPQPDLQQKPDETEQQTAPPTQKERKKMQREERRKKLENTLLDMLGR